MQTLLKASAMTAGEFISSLTFKIPPYQREYSWTDDEILDFWNDLSRSLHSDSYFLGLIILTDEGQGRKYVVDGQQRIITLTILVAALYHESLQNGRKALAERLQADFLQSINYETDETFPRVELSEKFDNETLQKILVSGEVTKTEYDDSGHLISAPIRKSFTILRENLRKDLAHDPFRRLGLWADFLTNHLCFAIFIHPDSAAAYSVFEIINTRGKELTTADLLKNYIISQSSPDRKDDVYKKWQEIAHQFPQDGYSSFVQYIRHAVTVRRGHILPRDLFNFLAQRMNIKARDPISSDELMRILEGYLSLYMQMIDPSLDGPSDPESLKIFSALNMIGVIAVRPLLMAIYGCADAVDGMYYVLKFVVRRIVVGNLGTGNIERRLGDAARKVYESRDWHSIEKDLSDLNPTRQEFIERVRNRSFSKGTAAFLRRSVVSGSMTPEAKGTLHFIIPRQTNSWEGMSEDDVARWKGRLANTFLSTLDRRPSDASTWEGFKKSILPHGIDKERRDYLAKFDSWDVAALEATADALAEEAGDVWY